MHSYKKYVNTFLFIIILFASFTNQHNPFVYTSTFQEVEVGKTSDPIYQKLKNLAKEDAYIEEPQDAYIDRVWKKTPGRNGKKINVEKSYQKMKDEGAFDEKLLVYQKVPPKISLEDLPAAPIYRGHPEKDMVAFGINVSWGTEYIPKILETLKKNKIKASFFIEGKWARENPDIVKMIHDENHLIGNHAYSHPDMARMNRAEIQDEISKTNEVISAIIGEDIYYFAPPSGSFTDDVVEIAHGLNMQTILWTVDTIDWKNPSVSVMINRVTQSVHPGAIILMHPTQVIADGLDELIGHLGKNYRLGRIDRLLDEDR
ncbi:polysaccharide deacetylase family protein [Oceanobacillus sp. CAU 1775]